MPLQPGFPATEHTNTGRAPCQPRQHLTQSSTTVRHTLACELCHIWWRTATATQRWRKKRQEAWEFRLRVKKCLILPLTHLRHCNGTSPPQLKIAHNQSTGRHISVLLKRINVQCRGQINGWQDSKSIDMDMLFGITSARHRPILISCAFVQWAAQR